jgi:hypothetical protein
LHCAEPSLRAACQCQLTPVSGNLEKILQLGWLRLNSKVLTVSFVDTQKAKADPVLPRFCVVTNISNHPFTISPLT